MKPSSIDPIRMLRPKRKIMGISAVLLPFTAVGEIDWPGFSSLVERVASFGLIPAVNMDTGYVHLLDDRTKILVLDRTREVLGNSRFVAGAFIADTPADRFNRDGYAAQIEAISNRGGIPVIFQSYGLVQQDSSSLIQSYAEIGRVCDRFIGFELGGMFAPFGRIYSLEVYAALMSITSCMGAKHSSLEREAEWMRLALRDEKRPDFHVFTGNDLAIDMVMYGSDYLLGLSCFAPDLFAIRDRCWEKGDPAFYEINDVLQYLGFFAFRAPVPAYKHSAAMFLEMRGWIANSRTHPRSPVRPDSDHEVLLGIARELGIEHWPANP